MGRAESTVRTGRRAESSGDAEEAEARLHRAEQWAVSRSSSMKPLVRRLPVTGVVSQTWMQPEKGGSNPRGALSRERGGSQGAETRGDWVALGESSMFSSFSILTVGKPEHMSLGGRKKQVC